MSEFQILQLVISIFTLGAFIFAIIKYFREPTIRNDKSISLFEARLDAVCDDIKGIKNNHLRHIENNMSDINVRMAKFETILEERLPKKQ